MKFRLNRTVARRANVQTVKRHLTKALEFACKYDNRLSVGTVSILQKEFGHYAEATITGRVPHNIEEGFTRHLAGILTTRFDPVWSILGEGTEVPADNPNNVDGPPPPVERPLGTVNLLFPPNTFERIYGREAQIRRIKDAVAIGKDTGWHKRKHTLLSGPPGCGKTDLLLTLAKALGKEGESYVWFDATSTTKAGAIEQMMQAPVLPPILFVEEIEKTPENSLRWLLGVMDDRGEIRRTNYRVGNQVKAARLTVIATANNVELLRAMDSGSIWSRFGNRIHCPPPDRPTLEKILTREVVEIDGKGEWARVALEFGYDQLKIHDCRELINIVLCGRDRLLTGEYQRDYLETMTPEDKDRLNTARNTAGTL